MGENTIGPRTPGVVPTGVPATQPRAGTEAPVAPAADVPGWVAGGPAAPVRTGSSEPAPAAAPAIDSATRDNVRNLNSQLATANANLASLKQQLATAQTQLGNDQRNQGFRDRLHGGSAAVQQDNATLTRLNGQLGQAQGEVTRLQGELDGAVTAALMKSPDYQARAKQLTMFTKADTATKSFLGQIDQTKKAISEARSAQNAQSGGDFTSAILGTTNDPLQQALHDSEVAKKKAKLAVASTRIETLGAQSDAWKAQIEAITNEQVGAADAGTMNVRMGTYLPLVSELVSPTLATGWEAFNDVANAVNLNKAETRVDKLREGVQGYDDQVSSKKRQLETTQNNAFVALKSQLLQ